MSSKIYDFDVRDSKGQTTSLKAYQSKVVLIVNVASRCGFTPQYDGLEALYKEYRDQGLVVLGFPCNQFGRQEPGSDSEIQEFCQMTFNTTFPVLGKIEVNGSKTSPLYQYLKKSAKGFAGTEMIKWNFTKFLVGRDGQVIKRYAPTVKPEDIKKDIEQALAVPGGK